MPMTEQGFRKYTYAELLEQQITRAKNLFGDDIDTSGKSVLGKYIRLNVSDFAQQEEALEALYQARYVDTACGVSLDRLAPFAGKLHCLKPNVLELAAMTGCEISGDADMERAADVLLERGTHCIVVSMGQRGCYWADRSGAKFYAALRPVSQMVDATGAGDAFMAGLLYAYLHRFPPERAARWALAAGIIAVTSAGTVSPGMSAELVNKILEENEL